MVTAVAEVTTDDIVYRFRDDFSRGPFYKHRLTLALAWISNYTHDKMLDEITYPFPNINGAAAEVREINK